MQPAKWPSLVFRVFGMANLLLAGICACITLLSVFGVAPSNLSNFPAAPHFSQVFWTMITINLIFELILAIAGIRLLQTRTQGLTICNALFLIEVLYFVGVSMPWFLRLYGDLSTSIGGAAGMGNGGLVVLWITGYPIITIVVLNVARRRLILPAAVYV